MTNVYFAGVLLSGFSVASPVSNGCWHPQLWLIRNVPKSQVSNDHRMSGFIKIHKDSKSVRRQDLHYINLFYIITEANIEVAEVAPQGYFLLQRWKSLKLQRTL